MHCGVAERAEIRLQQRTEAAAIGKGDIRIGLTGTREGEEAATEK